MIDYQTRLLEIAIACQQWLVHWQACPNDEPKLVPKEPKGFGLTHARYKMNSSNRPVLRNPDCEFGNLV